MSFSVASYNVLATAYIERARYRRTPSLLLNPAWRVPALVHHVANLDADLLCLQEVEPEILAPLQSSLGACGYGWRYARKRNNRPEGCAILYRQNVFELLDARVLPFADGAGVVPDSGYVALTASLRNTGRILQVTTTHLSWDPPAAAPAQQLGYRQIQEWVKEQEQIGAAADARILAGDLNVTPASEIVAMIESTGLRRAHRAFDKAFTCNVNGAARTIDHLFYSPALQAEPQAPVPIDDQTILPSAEQPSDHVAIVARFDWIDSDRQG